MAGKIKIKRLGRKIMCFKYKEKTGKELRKEAQRLGVSLEASANSDGTFREGAIQARVREAKRAKRENGLWIVALVSALASLFSAIAAWIATLK